MKFFSEVYDSWNEIQLEEYKKILDLLEKHKINLSEKILDIGCGEGKFELFLQENGFDVNAIGIDPDKKAIEKSNLQMKIVCSGDNIPFDDDYFSIVFCLDTIHLLKKNDYKRVLKKRGWLVISLFFNKQNLKEKESFLDSKLTNFEIVDKRIILGRENKIIILARKK